MPQIELKNIQKKFGSFQANKNISFNIKSGTIHGLCGENGAGKTTAMNILCGIHKPDGGELWIDSKKIDSNTPWNPNLASDLGIGMVHQHLMLAEKETVLDNIVLGVEKNILGFRQRKVEKEQLSLLMKQTGLEVSLEKKAGELPLGLQSRCEILKVLYRKASFLIFDEPTAVLTPQETDQLLKTFLRLKAEGHTILFVSHKLREVIEVCDEITVIRRGETVKTIPRNQATIETLSTLIVGEKVQLPKNELTIPKENSIFPFDFEVPAHTIVGIAGVEGNGQDQLAEKILKTARNQKKLKTVSCIPADRHREGLVLEMTLHENLKLKWQNRIFSSFKRFPKASTQEQELLNQYDVRPNNPEAKASALSGGNQQKVIAARELSDAKQKDTFVLAINPTRGVDLGAIRFLHQELLDCARAGASVVLISNELDELLALSNRIGVLYRGKIVTWFESPHLDEKKIGLAMLTGKSSAS